MNIIDSHTHLYLESFDHDRDSVIQKSLDNGVTHFLFPAIAKKYTKAMLDIKRKYDKHISLMTGLHPCYVRANWREEIEHIEAVIDSGNILGVGEIGLDFYRTREFEKEQKLAFITQLQLAKKHQLPFAIHCRNAFKETLEIIDQIGWFKGVFHCFTENHEKALAITSRNIYLGIGGVVTYKNCHMRQYLNTIPLKHIILETDAPYLAPVPFRGKRNESSYLTYILEHLAQIYNSTNVSIAKITRENTITLFDLIL